MISRSTKSRTMPTISRCSVVMSIDTSGQSTVGGCASGSGDSQDVDLRALECRRGEDPLDAERRFEQRSVEGDVRRVAVVGQRGARKPRGAGEPVQAGAGVGAIADRVGVTLAASVEAPC